MAVYISSNAIQNIPLGSQEVNDGGGVLKSKLFNSDAYLVALAKNNTNVAPLRLNMYMEAIRNIKSSILIIYKYYGDSAPNFVIVQDNDIFRFDETLQSNIVLFQNWVGLNETGIVDSRTLIALDEKISEEDLIDFAKKKYLGRNTRKKFKLYEDYNNGKYISTFFTYDSDIVIQVEQGDEAFVGTIISVGGEEPSSFIYENRIMNEFLDKNPNAKGSLKNKKQRIVYLDATTVTINDTTEFNEELAKTPPTLFDDPWSPTPYKVKAGDDFGEIVLQHYYGTGELTVKDPYTDEVIVTFPNREPFEVSKRSEDPRFQFYLNLLYYYNSSEVEGVPNSLLEWGMKKSSSYQRYKIEDLNDVNIFNNKYVSSDHQTALPNYYRFLKQMEAINPNSKIIIDTQVGSSTYGKVLSFVPDPGKNIIIPSRQLADTLYNYFNYRHNEMLTPVNDDEMDQVEGSALDSIIDTLRNAMDSLGNIIEEVKDDAVETYYEVADFFVKAYNFAIQSLTQYWPRGAGGRIGGEIDIVWGIPIKTIGSKEKMLWRKMSKQDELTICYRESMKIGAGAEVMSGASFGLYSGKGKSRKSLGIQAGVGAEAIKSALLKNEYEFPITKDETALLSMVIAVFGGTMVKNTARVLQYLDIINLDPRQYLSEMETTLEDSLNAWAAAQLGTGGSDTNKDKGIVMSGSDSTAKQNENKSYGFVDNIINSIPGIGAQVEGGVALGVSFTYKAKYRMNPIVPEIDARVPCLTETDFKFFIKGTLNTTSLGNFFQRYFIDTIALSGILDINFDDGVMLGVNFKHKRTEAASTVEFSDFRIDENSIVTPMADGTLTYMNIVSGDKVDKSSYMYFGFYSGDVDELAEPGSESKLTLNTGRLMQMFTDSDYDYSFSNVVGLFNKYQFRKKVGFFNVNSKSTTKKKNRLNRLADNNKTNQAVQSFTHSSSQAVEATLLKTFFKQVTTAAGLIEGGMALDVRIELEFETLALILEFYVKKLYYKYAILTTITDRNSFETDLFIKRSEILKYIADKIPEEYREGFAYYNYLFATTVSEVNPPFDGLNGYIDGLIANVDTSGTDFFESLQRLLRSAKAYVDYLNNKPPKDPKDILDYGVEDFMDAFSFITVATGLRLELEALLGASAGGRLAVGEGATAKVAVYGFLQLTYLGLLFENGELTDIDLNDPLRDILNDINATMVLEKGGKRIGVKTLFKLIKE